MFVTPKVIAFCAHFCMKWEKPCTTHSQEENFKFFQRICLHQHELTLTEKSPHKPCWRAVKAVYMQVKKKKIKFKRKFLFSKNFLLRFLLFLSLSLSLALVDRKLNIYDVHDTSMPTTRKIDWVPTILASDARAMPYSSLWVSRATLYNLIYFTSHLKILCLKAELSSIKCKISSTTQTLLLF